MSEKTENQTNTEEEQARRRAEFAEFQSGVGDLVLRLGAALSSLVVFGGVLYLAGRLHTLSYFFWFRASWLVWELPGNFFPFHVLLQVLIFISSVATGAGLIMRAESKRKAYAESKKWMKLSRWLWVERLISRHEPHKESGVGFSLLLLSFVLPILTITLLLTLRSPPSWMVTYSNWSYVLSFLWSVVFTAWAVFFVLGERSSKRDFFIHPPVLTVVMVLTMLIFPVWRPYLEGYATWVFMYVWGISFGMGVGARVLADLAHSNEGSLRKYSTPPPHGGWSATNALPLYLAFFGSLSLFSLTDGLEQSLYDLTASRSSLPIVMLKDGSCRHALLITSRHVYTVALQSSEPLDVVPFSWEKISRIREPLSGRCSTS